jgi:hypothetical protein
MNCNPTLTADEFKTIHNAVCDLDSLVGRLEEVLRPELYEKLVQARNAIRTGLASAYDQDDQAFSEKSRHFDSVKADLGVKHSEWSVYEVDNMSDCHPYEGVDRVIYRNHWGVTPAQASIQGLTWAALWVAANACIRDSGDDHHVYIESFEPDAEDPRTLVLQTGS